MSNVSSLESIKKLMRKFFQIFVLFIFGMVFAGSISAQTIVDKTVATVSDGIRTELITYSDLLWQLALEPETSINPPSSNDLNLALKSLIDQKLIGLESQRLPNNSINDDEVKAEIARLISYFANPSDFVKRLQAVGFESVSDDNFRRIIEQRIKIDKYLDFRFRSFVVISPIDEGNYYLNIFTPNFRKQNPGLLLPSLSDKRKEINEILTIKRVGEDIEKFLDDARERAEIIVLSEV
jgi:hypothetical protein